MPLCRRKRKNSFEYYKNPILMEIMFYNLDYPKESKFQNSEIIREMLNPI